MKFCMNLIAWASSHEPLFQRSVLTLCDKWVDLMLQGWNIFSFECIREHFIWTCSAPDIFSYIKFDRFSFDWQIGELKSGSESKQKLQYIWLVTMHSSWFDIWETAAWSVRIKIREIQSVHNHVLMPFEQPNDSRIINPKLRDLSLKRTREGKVGVPNLRNKQRDGLWNNTWMYIASCIQVNIWI